MSLSREAAKEICDYIREHSSTLFGQKFHNFRFINAVQVQLKGDKFETKFLVISKFRVFLLAGKQFSHLKVEKSFNILALRTLHVDGAESALHIGWEERAASSSRSAGMLGSLFIRAKNEHAAGELAGEFLSALKHYFPDIRPSLSRFLSISPASLLTAFHLLPSSTPDLPCNNFRRSYVTFCDYNDILYRDEVSWDVENIYFVHDIHEIRLDDFTHLTIRDQVAVLSCAQFSSYFTGIVADGCRIGTELIDALLTIIRRSQALKSLSIAGCSLPKDFSSQLAAALQHNPTIPLQYLNLSNNNLDDKKGIGQLAIALARMRTFKSLLLNDCSLSEKCVHHLSSGLYTGFSGDFGSGHAATQDPSISFYQHSGSVSIRFELSALHLSYNSLKDDANELVNFVSLCNTLRILDLSHTGFCVDRLWSALKLGGLRLERLHLAGCTVDHHLNSFASKSARENNNNVYTIVKELFSSMVDLKVLDLAGTPVGGEILQNILVGITNNNCISAITLNLDGVLDPSGSKSTAAAAIDALERYVAACPIAHLSLRNNALEQDMARLLPELAHMRSLRRLDLGGANFQTLRTNKKHAIGLSKVLNEMSNLIASLESQLEELVLSDCRLGAACMSVVLEPLASTRLISLDVSGNELCNIGARFLAKSLQLNTSLQTLCLDRNQIGVDGFSELEHGLRFNYSLQRVPFPLNDAANTSDRQRVMQIFTRIDEYLERNRRGDRLANTCCQSVLQNLILKCDSYNINASDEKKIIFHNLLKSIAESRNIASMTDTSDVVERLVNEFYASSKRIDIKRVINARHTFRDLLAARCVEPTGDADVNFFNVSPAKHASNDAADKVEERQNPANELKDALRRALSVYFIRSLWADIGEKADALLRASNSFRVLGDASIDNSVHATIGASSMGRRPNSIFHESLVASLISNDAMCSSAASFLGADGEAVESKPLGSALVHLAKNRPKPPRQFKNQLNTLLKQSSGSLATDDSFDYANDFISASSKMERKSRQSSGSATGNSPQLCDSVKNVLDLTTPPPPLVPRRRASPFGNILPATASATPPKLPPKPSASPSITDGINAHSRHHRVSPVKLDDP